MPALPAATTYVEIAAGTGYSMALRSDGVIVEWGATFSFAVPPAPVLVGLPLYQQALLGDPGVNPAGMVASHAGESVIVQ